jgi:hypothetical protein
MSSCVVRVRPAAQISVGRSMRQAQGVVRSLVPGPAPASFDVEFTLDVPLTLSQLEVMAEELVTGATADDVVFVEASFSTSEVARSYQVLDALISGLLAQEAVLRSPCKVIVCMQEIPNLADQVHDLLCIDQFHGRFAIVDAAGRHLGDANLAGRVLDSLQRDPAPDDTVDRAILRHRGVFRGSNSGRVNNHLFYYDVLLEASPHFQARLVSALSHIRPDVVVFDTSTSGAWFPSMVQAACVQLQTAGSATLTAVDLGQLVGYHDGLLQEPQKSRVEAAEAVLSRPESVLAVVVPSYASGRTLSRAVEIVGAQDLARFTGVAVFADAAVSLEESALPGMQGVARQPYGGRNIEVHCMHQVEMRTIERDDWLVAAAEALGEVRELPVGDVDRRALGIVALWSLYADCGVRTERVPAGGRPPKRYFPDLARLDDWDSYWLAEAAVLNILERLPRSNRATLLIVIPAEENGSQPITRALAAKCRTPVLPVRRAMIDGDEPLTPEMVAKLRRHKATPIAIFDESTVTHGTLEKLARLVERNIQILPDLVGAVIDLSTEPMTLGIPFFSLTRWTAFAEETAT